MATELITPAARLADLVERLAASTEIDQLADELLGALGALFDARRTGFYLFDRGERRPEFVLTRGVSDYFLARYERDGRERDPLLWHVVTRRCAIDNSALMPLPSWRALPFYHEVLALHRLDNVLEIPIVADGEVLGTLNLAGGERGSPRRAEELALATVTGRLVGQAVRTLRDRSAAARERDQLLVAFDLVDDGVVLTDLRTGRRRLNRAARAILARIEGSDAALDDLLAQAPPPGAGVVLAAVALIDGESAQIEISTVTTPGDPALTVTRLQLRGSSRPLPAHLRDVLSPREQEVVGHVVGGLPDKEVAARLAVSVHTVRDHLKSVYRKLGVHARIDLVRLLGPEAGSAPSPPATGEEPRIPVIRDC